MDERIRSLLELLAEDLRTKWVADQLLSTFREGIEQKGESGSSREKYESTRPYSFEEQLEMTRFALTAIFLELPAITESALYTLTRLNHNIESIKFIDEGGNELAADSRSVLMSSQEAQSSRAERAVWIEKLIEVASK